MTMSPKVSEGLMSCAAQHSTAGSACSSSAKQRLKIASRGLLGAGKWQCRGKDMPCGWVPGRTCPVSVASVQRGAVRCSVVHCVGAGHIRGSVRCDAVQCGWGFRWGTHLQDGEGARVLVGGPPPVGVLVGQDHIHAVLQGGPKCSSA